MGISFKYINKKLIHKCAVSVCCQKFGCTLHFYFRASVSRLRTPALKTNLIQFTLTKACEHVALVDAEI